MAKIREPRELFVKELGEILYVEKELANEVLPELTKQVTHPQFKKGLEKHLQQTREHVQNVEQAFALLGETPAPEKSRPMDGLKQQHDMTVRDIESEQLRDFFNACAAGKTEHMEISAYTGLITSAEALGEEEIVDLLEQNLADEKETLRQVEQVAEELARQPATA
jgi:ferritin-like metal-binding protein YciE